MEDAKRKFSIKKSVLESKLAINKTNRAIIEKRAGLDQIHLALAVHMPSLSDKRRYGAEIMSTILGGGMSSRLWQEVREKLGIAYSIHSLVEQEMSYGSLIIYAGINKDYQNKVREVILKEIKKLQDLKEKELEEAKEQLIGNFSLENENGINTAQHLALNEMAMEAEEFYRYPERISEVKLEDVKKLAKIKKYSFVALAPK
jgi:predicted Zn-dependent peptidase